MLVAFCLSGLVACPSSGPPTLGFPGTLPIQRWDTTYQGNLPLTIYYPDTTPRQSKLPLVVFTVGWNQTRASYFGYGKQLAQWGYVAVLRAYPAPSLWGIGMDTSEQQIQQVSDVIDWCTNENLREQSPLYGMVDSTRVGSAGHSYGGVNAVASAVHDARISAAVNLDSIVEIAGSPDFTELNAGLSRTYIPILFVGTDRGVLCSGPRGPNALPMFDVANPPSEEIIIHGAAHIDFIEQSQGLNVFGQLFCGGGIIDKNEVRAIASRYMISWFNVYLKDLTAFDTYFRGELSAQDAAGGKVSIRTKFESNGSDLPQ